MELITRKNSKRKKSQIDCKKVNDYRFINGGGLIASDGEVGMRLDIPTLITMARRLAFVICPKCFWLAVNFVDPKERKDILILSLHAIAFSGGKKKKVK